MYYGRIYVVVFVSFVFCTIVKGSCLEYGHSCWGAHGKRSGSATAAAKGEGEILRSAVNLRGNEYPGNNQVLRSDKNLLEKLDELNAPTDSKDSTILNDEEMDDRRTANIREPSRLRNLLQKHNEKQRNNIRIADDSLEQEARFAERWRKLPLYSLKALTKSQQSNSENDLLQQPLKVYVADESFYYDFQ